MGADRVQSLLMAEIYQAAGDQESARARLADHPAQIRQRLETEPTNGPLWQALSRMEAILGHKDEALRCAIKATEFPEAKDGFDGPSAWINLAIIRDVVRNDLGDLEAFCVAIRAAAERD